MERTPPKMYSLPFRLISHPAPLSLSLSLSHPELPVLELASAATSSLQAPVIPS